jgi:hypothetical protein
MKLKTAISGRRLSALLVRWTVKEDNMIKGRWGILKDISQRRGPLMAAAILIFSPFLLLWVGIGEMLERAGKWMKRIAH